MLAILFIGGYVQDLHKSFIVVLRLTVRALCPILCNVLYQNILDCITDLYPGLFYKFYRHMQVQV